MGIRDLIDIDGWNEDAGTGECCVICGDEESVLEGVEAWAEKEAREGVRKSDRVNGQMKGEIDEEKSCWFFT